LSSEKWAEGIRPKYEVIAFPIVVPRRDSSKEQIRNNLELASGFWAVVGEKIDRQLSLNFLA